MAGRSYREKEWIPKTELGKKVFAGEVASLEEILASGKKILEPQIIDFLLRGQTKEEVLEVTSTQRMTGSGRKQLMRAVVLLGSSGFVGVGVGKAFESRDAIQEAILDAKKHLVKVSLGCGSWECGCGLQHSLPQEVRGSNGSTKILIKPAPRGVGIVAGGIAKKVLDFAGVEDAWTFSRGRTRNILNTVLATINALDSLNRLKKGKESGEDEGEGESTSAMQGADEGAGESGKETGR